MHYEWVRSPAFWWTLATPLCMLIAVALLATHARPGVGDLALLAALGGLTAGLIGARLAARERRLRRAGHEVVDADDASLPAARAATYRDLFENATDIVFTTDLSGHFLAGNKAVQRQLGYTVEEAKSLTWEKLVAPYDMWKARQMYWRHARGELRISFELDTVTAAGDIKTFEIGSRPMYRGDELCGFHGIARDITSRKEMERQLESARREAETANRFKSTFLANMSHEIRTPINGILGFMSLFAKTELAPVQKEYLVPVEESARHLLKIINDILDLSKIEAGRFCIDSEAFNYRDVVKGAVDLLRPLGEDKGLSVQVEFDAGIPQRVVGDGTRIGQVVSNLVSNAIKFTDAGSVVVNSRLQAADESNLVMAVSVRDTGIGIAPGDRESLFEPFSQADVRPDRRYAGTGLGLSISRNLVEAMGGGIEVHSEPGHFTEVVFTLPLAPAVAEAPAAAPQNAAPGFDGTGLSALIVDDNEINRWYLRAVLEQYGIGVWQGDCGRAALERCRQQRFDVVFMDIHMADLDGVETTRRLRAQLPAYRQVPVVAVSADVVGDPGKGFTRRGLDQFLAKPVTEADVTGVLSDLFPHCARPEAGRNAESAGNGDGRAVLDPRQGLALASRDEALWRRGVETLRQQAAEAVPALRAAREQRDHREVRRLAHKLAGAAEYVAAVEVAGRARELEQAAAGGQDEAMVAQTAELEGAIGRLIEVDVKLLT